MGSLRIFPNAPTLCLPSPRSGERGDREKGGCHRDIWTAHPPFEDLTDTWDICTIESNRACEKLACYLTSEEEVVWRFGGAARGGDLGFRISDREVNRHEAYQLGGDLRDVYHRYLFWRKELGGPDAKREGAQ